MNTETPQLVISRVFDAPRQLVYRAFTDPDHLAAWWGPIGNSLPRDEIEFDVRPGGFQRWTEVNAAEPELRVHIHVDLTDVADGELLEGVMHVSGVFDEHDPELYLLRHSASSKRVPIGIFRRGRPSYVRLSSATRALPRPRAEIERRLIGEVSKALAAPSKT